LVIDSAIDLLKEEAVFLGLKLPEDIIKSILEYSINTNCTIGGFQGEFYYRDIQNGQLQDGQAIAIAFVNNPMKCEAVQKIVNDPLIMKIVWRYLRYYPNSVQPRLIWSFVSEISDIKRRRLNQTIDYHFDVDGYNFVYANFYISDVDKMSGAHVMIKKSHNRKPVSMLFCSARQPDEVVLKCYGEENEVIIEGTAGTGFLQDASCYHKALPPINRDRLMLQIRYS